MDMDDVPTEKAPSSVWPLATGPERARWAAQAVERYRHMAWIIMTHAAAWPAPKDPFPPQALDLARRLYEAIDRPRDIGKGTPVGGLACPLRYAG